MRAFITGISGFAGGHLAEWLCAAGDRVAGANRTGRWPHGTPESVRAAATLLAWDLGAGLTDETRRQVRDFGPEVVYHLGALSVPADCGEQEPTPRAWAVNVTGTSEVLELVRSLPHRPRLVMVSSAHVYGAVPAEQPVVSEETPVAPQSAYARTKCAAEQLVLAVIREGGVDGLVARAFKHAGPRQGERMMLAEWARQLVAGASPVVVRCLDSHLDLTDVRDVVRAYRLLAERGQTGMVYNVGSGRSVRTGDLFATLRRLADSQAAVRETAPGFRQEMIADARRLTAATGWRPEIPLEQTLLDTLADWRRRESAPAIGAR